MKNVLFVDDEPLLLQGLQRMLRPLRNEWEMTFVESGAAALALMEQQPFDVVVSDMKMPGMDGAALLTEVSRRSPQTVRLILTGYADQSLLIKCVGVAHQCMAKPCDAESLKLTVSRAATLGNSLNNESVKKLVSRMDRLPSVPALYAEMVDVLRSPAASVEDIARIVQRDPAMTAKILKMVNSAFFGLSRSISSPFDAISYLGIETIKSLVLSVNAFSQYEKTRLGGLLHEALWQHSLRTAEMAKQIARSESLPGEDLEEVFVAGLLHDTGKVVLASNFPREYEDVVRIAQPHQRTSFEAEREIFGCDHAEVGGYLLGLWGLPAAVVEAITLHHHPVPNPQASNGTLVAVHAANALVHEAAPRKDGPKPSPLDLDFVAEAGFAHRVDEWRQLAQPAEVKETAHEHAHSLR
jgi:putative nucleotidyltransferase with HDIG domain